MKKIVLLVSGAISTLAMQQSVVAAENDAVEIDKIVVTADPFGDRAEDELISAVTVISDEVLDRKKATTLGETLDGLPGVTNSDFGPGVGRPVIRGLTGSRVQTLNNGLKISDISGEGADHNIAIDTSSATQIEVIRGPATLLYGGNATGGVINVISDDFSPYFSEQTEVNGQYSYGEMVISVLVMLELQYRYQRVLCYEAATAAKKMMTSILMVFRKKAKQQVKKEPYKTVMWIMRHFHYLVSIRKTGVLSV